MSKTTEFNEALRANGVELIDPIKDLSRFPDSDDMGIIVGLAGYKEPEDEDLRQLYENMPILPQHRTAINPVTGVTYAGEKASAYLKRFLHPGELKISADTLVKNTLLHYAKQAPAGYATVAWGFGYDLGYELAMLYVERTPEQQAAWEKAQEEERERRKEEFEERKKGYGLG